MTNTRLFIIDPSRALVEATRSLFADSEQIQIVGWATTAEEALGKLAQLHPDLVLVDLVQADHLSFQLIRAIKGHAYAPAVVVMSLYDSQPFAQLAREVGADGFVSKAELVTQLEPLVAALQTSAHRAHAGETTSPMGMA
ncbi:MAG: response regulator [Chloroflexales bacterium]